jgi:L-fucose mutarotase/ribose pyranase (RbsD/FucU family)
MAQPKALKSPYGQKAKDLSPEPSGEFYVDDVSDFVVPSGPLPDEDIIPAGTALQETPRGLPPEGQQQQAERPFQGPLAPEFYQGQTPAERFAPVQGMFPTPGPQYAGAEGGIEPVGTYSPEDIDKLIDAGELGTSIALGYAFPGMGLLGISTTAGALNYVKNTLKNQLVPDAQKKEEVDKIFNGVVTSALTGGIGLGLKGAVATGGFLGRKALETETGQAIARAAVTNKSVRWFLDKLIQDSSKTGDDAIASHAKSMYDDLAGKGDLSYDQMIAKKAADAEAAKMAGVELTSGEMFYFDPEARQVTQEALSNNPGIARAFAERLGRYTKTIKNLFGKEEQIPTGGLKAFVDQEVKNHQIAISRVNKELMASAKEAPEAALAGDELLAMVDDSLSKFSKNLDADVLSRQAPRLWTLRQKLADQLKLGKAQEFIGGKGGSIVDLDGKPIKRQAAKLALSDVQTFIDDLSSISDDAFTMKKKGTLGQAADVSYSASMDLRAKAAAIRDNMSEQIANRIGRPELASRIAELRKNYSSRIDSWRTVQNELSEAPVGEIKYLFTKADAKTAGQIMSVFPEQMQNEIRREFIGRMINPTYLAEAGESAAVRALEAVAGGNRAFKVAKDQWSSYDRGVLKAVYGSDETVDMIGKFLDLGARAEKFLASANTQSTKAGEQVASKMIGLMRNPSVSGALQEMVSLLPIKSPLRNKLGPMEYIAEKRAIGDVSEKTARALGAPEASGAEVIGRSAKAMAEKARPATTAAKTSAGTSFGQLLGNE